METIENVSRDWGGVEFGDGRGERLEREAEMVGGSGGVEWVRCLSSVCLWEEPTGLDGV